MKQKKILLLAVLILSMMLGACGGEATTEENTEETAVALVDELLRVEEGGYAFQPPLEYEYTIDYIFAEMIGPGEENKISIVGTPFDDGMNLDTMYEGFTAEFRDDDTVTLGERETLSVKGLDGFSVAMEGEDNGVNMKGKLVALGNDSQGVFIFGSAPESQWDDEAGAIFDAVVNSINFFAAREAALDEPVADDAGITEETATPETTEETAVPLPVGSTDAGFACFGSAGKGMTCLSADGQWQQYTRDNGDLGSDFIADMSACADGTLMIAHSDGVSAFDGENFRNYESGWGYGSPEGVACTADGNIWVAHFGGVSYYDGSAWTTYASAEHLATGEQASDLVNDVVVDGDGNVWVVTSNAIAMYDGAAWTRYQLGEGLADKYFFDQLVVDGNGRPWALHSNGLLEFDGAEWIAHENDSYFSPEAVAIAPDGSYWIATYSDGVANFKGGAWSQLDMGNSDLSSDGGRSIAIDNNGRLYVGTIYGLNIIDGDAWTTYNMDNADMVSHNIDSIGIINGGPALPALADKENGSVTGSLEEDGAPLAGAAVELCVRELYSSYTGDTPCSDQSAYYTTTTDNNGAFTFEDIPVGIYYIVFETDTGWGKLTDEYGIGSEEVPVAPGETTDVGAVALTAE